MRILHLTLKKKWFDLIASGEKKIEYREIKPYWTKRLYAKCFDEIHFRNGYAKDSPFMRVEFLGSDANGKFEGLKCYRIYLGEILELRNTVKTKTDLSEVNPE